MVCNHDSLAVTDGERTSLAPRRRGGGRLPISNLANNVTARVRAPAAWLPELHVDYPRNKRAQEMSGALPHPWPRTQNESIRASVATPECGWSRALTPAWFSRSQWCAADRAPLITFHTPTSARHWRRTRGRPSRPRVPRSRWGIRSPCAGSPV